MRKITTIHKLDTLTTGEIMIIQQQAREEIIRLAMQGAPVKAAKAKFERCGEILMGRFDLTSIKVTAPMGA